MRPEEFFEGGAPSSLNIDQGNQGGSQGADVIDFSTYRSLSSPNRSEVSDMADNDRLTDEKIARAQAETQAKFVEILGEVRLISSDLKGEMGKINTRLNSVERSTTGVKATIIATAIVGIGIVIAILGYAQQWFGLGLATRDTIRTTIREMQAPPELPAPPKPH